MNYMNKLNELERTKLSVKCDSFFLCSKANNHFKNVFDVIHKDINIKHKEIWLVINASTKALRNEMLWSEFPLNKNHYSQANKIHKQRINYNKTRQIIEAMVQNGWIDFYVGFYDNLTDTSYRSCFMITDKFKELFDMGKVLKYGSKQDKGFEIEIRNKDREVVSCGQGKKGSAVIREEIKALNDMLKSHDISLFEANPTIAYKRIFKDDFSKAGRWYTLGGFQTIPSEYRKFITINGEPTVELDYSSMHPCILYTKEGVELKSDFTPYGATKLLDCVTDVQWRNLCKDSLLCMLNAEQRSQAAGAIYYKIKMDASRERYGMPKNSYDIIYMIINELEQHNRLIKNWFYYQDLWALLQHYDSEIMNKIVNSFVAMNKPLLLYHDSVMVRESDKEFLKTVMVNSWKEVMETEINCRITEK